MHLAMQWREGWSVRDERKRRAEKMNREGGSKETVVGIAEISVRPKK